jgi:hypothetical protein
MSETPIFSVTNHHAEDCGAPPHIDDRTSKRYRGYFETEDGEQAIFVYDFGTRTGTLQMGDAGWEVVHTVLEGDVPGLNLRPTERTWLAACWTAAVRR